MREWLSGSNFTATTSVIHTFLRAARGAAWLGCLPRGSGRLDKKMETLVQAAFYWSPQRVITYRVCELYENRSIGCI